MLFLKKQEYELMLEHCQKELPHEACGLLGGRKEGENGYVEKVYLLTNTDHSREHFSMEPREQLVAVKDMRVNGYELLGNFHSHPQSPSRPSEEDKRLAYDNGIRYLILSLMEEEPVPRAFWIDEEKQVKEEPVEIETSPCSRTFI